MTGCLLILGFVGLLTWLLCVPHIALAGHSAVPAEYQVKAAFLMNFPQFVEWPQGTLAPGNDIVVGILGNDPFGDSFEPLKAKTVKGRRIAIRQLATLQEGRDCQILFISASERRRLPQILKVVNNVPVLTVADMEGFCEAGGMINFAIVKNKVGFQVNKGAAGRAGLKISAQLLKLALDIFE